MKKLLALAMALIMVFALAACGGDTEPAPSGGDTADPGTQQTDPGASEPEPSDQDDPGDVVEWPDNEFTNLIPQPEGGTVFSEDAVDNAYFEGHTMTMTDWSVEDCKAYAEALIAAGFDKPGAGFDSVVITDNDSIYSFGAENEDGVYVTFGTSVAQKTGSISIQVTKNE
ncbi:MAG: hypothetical protein Q4B48_03225 [Syntrophomonadaceae bacterium]|nr:hypothetical protein [Syntrophomonadaceae bacterium]